MFRILITDDLSPQGLAKLEADPDVRFDLVDNRDAGHLAGILKDYDAWIIRSRTQITAELLKQADRLKVIGRAGVGVDNVDVHSASLRGIVVMNTPGASTVAVAEYTVALLLALCRNVAQARASMVAGEWERDRFVGVDLSGKTLGIIGLGQIGAQVSRRCQAFGVHILAYDPYLSD